MTDLFSTFASILEPVRTLAGEQPVYLVGGAVRDAMLGKPVHDLDFVLLHGAGNLARKVAKSLNAPFYMLDKARDTARVIHAGMALDFAAARMSSLEDDLRARDFTINALAVELNRPRDLIDLLGGAEDLRKGILRLCSDTSLQDDPVRVLRAVRQALELQFRIAPQTIAAIHAAVPSLARVSAERQRDELLRMLAGPRASAAVRLLRHFDALSVILPELAHHSDPANDIVQGRVTRLEGLLSVLTGEFQADKAANFARTAASKWLGRFRPQFSQHLGYTLNPIRPASALLVLAALFLPVGDGAGMPASIPDEQFARAATNAASRGRALALSTNEIQRLDAAIRYQTAFRALSNRVGEISRRDIYWFFKQCGEAGVEVILLSLAASLAAYGAELPIDFWERELTLAYTLLEAWWMKADEQVRPPLLLTGHDLMQRFKIPAGPQVGYLLELLEEAQAAGEVTDRESALQFIGARLDLTSR